MATKKVTVEFVKRYEDRDKNGQKLIIAAGTRTEMTPAEAKKAGDKIRIIPEEPAPQSQEGDTGEEDPGE